MINNKLVKRVVAALAIKELVERVQEAARQSQDYFENTAIYRDMEPMQFAFNLLSRSGRIDYDDLRVRDQHFVGAVDGWFIGRPPTTATGCLIGRAPARRSCRRFLRRAYLCSPCPRGDSARNV